MKRVFIGNKLQAGNRVRGFDSQKIEYEGVVFSVYSNCATIKRDDGEKGTGDMIAGFGNGWVVSKQNGINKWWSDGDRGGELKIIG